MNRRILAGFIIAGLGLASCSSDDGAAQVLDDAFGDEGVTESLTRLSDDGFLAVAEGPGGTIYATGFSAGGVWPEFAVARFNADGTRDFSYAEGGVALLDLGVAGGVADVGRALVVHDDGSVVVVGPMERDPTVEGPAASDIDIAVFRLDPDGYLDVEFGRGGVMRLGGGGKDIDAETHLSEDGWGVTIRDGGYAVFGVTPIFEEGRTDLDYFVLGLTDDGEIDRSFGSDGVVTADVNASDDIARTINTQADGQLVATGFSRDAEGLVSPVLIRMSADGVLDETFGNGGIATDTILDGVTESHQVGFQGENYILTGYGRDAVGDENGDLIVYRFLADGTWDPTFGTDGVTRVDLAGLDDHGHNLVVLEDGSIVVVGSGEAEAGNVDAMIVRLHADGTLDEEFGDGGRAVVDLNGRDDAFVGADLTADGSAVLIAGHGRTPKGEQNGEAVVVRLPLTRAD